MTQSDLVDALAAAEGLTKTRARLVLDTVIGLVVGALVAGEDVPLRGLGTLRPVDRSARSGTGIDGRPWQSSGGKRIKFRPSGALSDVLKAPAHL